MNKIERRIRKAFNCTDSLDSISNEEAIEANHDIHALDNASVLNLLPLLMLKEMYNKTSETGDSLIRFFDVALLKRDKQGNLIPRDEKIHAEIYRFQNERFKNFTKEQARAIYFWLRHIANQKAQYKRHAEIFSALFYWKNRYEK